ncbi:MAG: glycosyltransferase family 4 protein [Candidatus Omnitrophica bacterium]|nr:glycosyltransferase family 4 protein [Candidatus Omnitrophota bacterium]
MRILMLHPHDIFSPLEPWTIRIVSFAKEFTKLGYKVKLVYFPLEFSTQTKPQYLNPSLEVIPLRRELGLINFIKNIIIVNKLAKWAEIIHFQKCFYWASIPALLASFLNNKPIHYDWDDWETEIFYECPDSHFLRNLVGRFMRLTENLIPHLVDTISVSSQALYDLCVKLCIPEEKIYIVSVGADLEKFNPNVSGEEIKKRFNLRGKVVLYLGQLHSGQYAEQFIYTANEILKEKKDEEINFLIVGGGFKLNHLKELTKKLNLDSRVIFTGPVTHNEVPKFIAASDICIACFEDNRITRCKSPLKITEYLASGKAIVASDVGEVRKMLNGAGILIKPEDIRALKRGINVLLKDRYLKEDLEKKSRERAERYTWRISAEKILNAYLKNLSNKS